MAITIARPAGSNPAALPGPRRRGGARPEINITPLVDVVLVLLIIFMVVTPQLEAGESVELPGVFNPDAKAKSRLDPITITCTASGKYFIEKEQLPEHDLRPRLEREHGAHPERRLVLKGDKGIAFGRMRQLFSTCKDVGFTGVSLVVGERRARGADGS